MARKNKQRKTNTQAAASSTRQAAPIAVTHRKPEIPAFWVAVIIPIICLVGAWTYPPVATPMELKSYASQIYLSGLLLVWLWMQRKAKSMELTFSPGRVAFGLLFLAGTLSLLWSPYPYFWVYKWNKWFAGFVVFLLGLQLMQNEKNTDRVISLVILGALITAAIGIGQYLFGLNVVPQTSFPSSTFGNGNMAGQVMVLTLPLPLYFLFRENLSIGKTWFYALTLVLLLAYTFYTRTRAVWLAGILEIFLIAAFVFFDKTRRSQWLFWNPEKTRAAITAGVILFVMLNVDANGFQPFWQVASFELSSISTSIATSAEQSGGQRYLIWGIALEMLKNSPLIGTGLGSFFGVYNLDGYANYRIMGVQRVHNDVLELAVELGALGILLLLGIIVTMCILLYKLILRSEGRKRKLYAFLTIAVTGSMLNAQLSFPYELPVPLVIMPFYMALVIRGSEDIENNTWTLSFKPWLMKASLSLSGIVFAFLVVNDLAWFRDVHVMNKIIKGEITGTPWKPINPIYNQVYFTASRSVGDALRNTGRQALTLQLIDPIVNYWPGSPTDTIVAAENHLALGQFEEAEYWSKKTIETEPKGSYVGESFLNSIYIQQNKLDELRDLYEKLKKEPEDLLSRYPNTYTFLHSASINLQDYEMTQYFFDKYQEYFGESAAIVANQAVFYINTGNYGAAAPYMRHALELDPNIALASRFKEILSQLPAD